MALTPAPVLNTSKTADGPAETGPACGARPHLLFGLAVLPFPRLLLDVCDHGERGSVMTVGQVDDVGDGREHGPLAAGTNGRAFLTHGQEELQRQGQR